MSDTLKAILSNAALWSALISAITTTVLYLNPNFPREILAVWGALICAVFTAVGIGGVTAVSAKAREIKTDREIAARNAKPNR